MSPRYAPPAPPGCSPISRTPPRCWTPSSPHDFDRLRSRRRAGSQGAGRRPRGAAARARACGRATRVSRRDARSALRPGGRAGSARRGAADAHLPARRRRARVRGAGLEGATLAARALPAPSRGRSAGRRCRCGRHCARAPGVRGLVADRPHGGGLPAGAGGPPSRVVSRDGRAAGGRGRAGRDRARHHGDGPAPRPLLRRVAPAFRGGVRGPHRPARPHRGAAGVSTVKIPMPLRVPELAPSLGRVVVPRRVAEPWVPIDDVREALATRVLELAGEARAAAAQEDRDRVLDAVSRRAWLAAWERAVRRVAERVIEALDERIARAAWRVRMPHRRWRRRLLSTPEKRAVAARLATGGEPFVGALDA